GLRPGPPRGRAGPAGDARRVARPLARHPPRGRGRRRALPRRPSHHDPRPPGVRVGRAGAGALGDAQGLPVPPLRHPRPLRPATPGESDPRHAYRSALILAPDPDSGADPTATESDGTITAEQIARTWELDADLVVLSACESGLGLAAAGEGYLGFAQPLFARGA